MAVRQLRSIDGSGQTAMDETPHDDKELSDLLEKRLRLYDDKAEVQKAYKAAHQDVVKAIEKLDLPDGGAIRVGRFRISRIAIPARHVDFDTDATSRLQIELFS